MASFQPAVIKKMTTTSVANGKTSSTVTTTTPISIVGSTNTLISGIVVDTASKTVHYEYLCYVYYKDAHGIQHLASAFGPITTAPINDMCSSAPNVTITATTVASITGVRIDFIISTVINYNKCPETIANIYVE